MPAGKYGQNPFYPAGSLHEIRSSILREPFFGKTTQKQPSVSACCGSVIVGARLASDGQDVFPCAAEGVYRTGRVCHKLLHRQVNLTHQRLTRIDAEKQQTRRFTVPKKERPGHGFVSHSKTFSFCFAFATPRLGGHSASAALHAITNYGACGSTHLTQTHS